MYCFAANVAYYCTLIKYQRIKKLPIQQCDDKIAQTEEQIQEINMHDMVSNNRRLKLQENFIESKLSLEFVQWKIGVAEKDEKIYELPHGKTNNLHRRKQRRRSASQ